MKNKYIFINLTILLSFLLFIPIIFAQAETYPTYIGIGIDNIYNSNYSSPTEWCFPKRETSVSIMYGEETLSIIEPITDTCAGDEIWSELIELTTEENYSIEISINSQCNIFGGIGYNGYCWYATDSAVSHSCTSLCDTLLDVGECQEDGFGLANERSFADYVCELICPNCIITDAHEPACGAECPGHNYTYCSYNYAGYGCGRSIGSTRRRICPCSAGTELPGLEYIANFIAP
ncbi:MAG: hypothetical protein PHN37_02685 [Candidatus Pacebacteria bacterium]|nr:hypothetical protein [Candidatus Paceibacterota bacterium]